MQLLVAEGVGVGAGVAVGAGVGVGVAVAEGRGVAVGVAAGVAVLVGAGVLRVNVPLQVPVCCVPPSVTVQGTPLMEIGVAEVDDMVGVGDDVAAAVDAKNDAGEFA
jgi:hypothetical protein